MPLEKRLNGQLITRTKRRGDRILVRLRNPADSLTRNTWIAVTQEGYRQAVTCVFRPRITVPDSLLQGDVA